MTAHYQNHFILKLFDGNNFVEFDNSNRTNFHISNDNNVDCKGNEWLITQIFYEIEN